VLFTSFSLLVVPWTLNFGCKVTSLDLLNFQASIGRKFCSSQPLTSSVKQGLNLSFPKRAITTSLYSHGTIVHILHCRPTFCLLTEMG
jgi:hypothetical protein